MSNISNVLSYYRNALTLKTYYNWSLDEIDDLLPWEYLVYLSFIKKDNEERKQKLHQKTKS